MSNIKQKKILIIEDDAAISSMYRAKFEGDGFFVLDADNGLSGLELAIKEIPNLVLLDVILPQLDGFAVLSGIKNNAKTKNVPVVMLTNLGTSEDREKGEKLGAVDYLIKASFTPIEIAEKAKKFIK
jgi:DNA-binding response OmpR family regulator